MSDDESFHENADNEADDDVIYDDEEEPQQKKSSKVEPPGRFNIRDFADIEAEDEDEEDEEAEMNDVEYGEEDRRFVTDEVDDNEQTPAFYRLYNREREEEVREIAERIEQRHKHYVSDETNTELNSGIVQQAMQPSVADPKLWTVKCTPGEEKRLITQLMHKFIIKQQDNPLQIFSVCSLDHLKGYIYVEAFKEAHVREAILHMDGIFPFKITLVPLKEMKDVLTVPKKKISLPPRSWVRVKRGPYKGDIASVSEHDEGSPYVYVRIVPRLDFQNLGSRNQDDDENDYDDEEEQTSVDGRRAFTKQRWKRKRPRKTERLPARLFDAKEVEQMFGEVVTERDSPTGEPVQKFAGYAFKDGLLYKRFLLRMLQTENVIPTLEEHQKFHGLKRGEDDEDRRLDNTEDRLALSTLPQRRKIVFQKNDNVIVTEGELKNLVGRVHSVDGDTVSIISRDFKIDPLPIPRSYLQKFFRTGDHVKVETGSFEGETGLIVKISDNVATLISDVSQRELKVFTSDIRECAEISTGLKFGDYVLYDLVQLDMNTVGVITQIERDSAQVLDMNGKTRSVKMQGIRGKKDDRKSFGRDSDSSVVGAGDLITVIKGDFKGEKGVIKHIFRAFTFIHTKTRQQNGGIFVVRTKNCRLQGTSKNKQMAHGNRTQDQRSGRNGPLYPGRGQYFAQKAVKRRNDEMLHQNVQITKGPWKGYIGIVKDTDETHYLIELQTNAKRVRIPRETVKPVDSRGREDRNLDDYDVTRTPHPGMTPLHVPMTPRTPSTPSHDPFNPNAPMTPLHTPSSMPVYDDDEDDDDDRPPKTTPVVAPTPTAIARRGIEVPSPAPSPAARTPFAVEVPPRTPSDFPPPPRTPGSLSEYQVPASAFSATSTPASAATPRTPFTPLPQTPRTPSDAPRTPGDALSDLLGSSFGSPPVNTFTPAPRTPGGGGLIDFDNITSVPGGKMSNLSSLGRTPSTPLTPRTPTTPGGNGPATPQTPGGVPQTPSGSGFTDFDTDSEEATFFPGIEVHFDDSYKGGSYANKVGVVTHVSGDICTVAVTKTKTGERLSESEPPFLVNGNAYLVMVTPEKKDNIIVVKGEKKGQTGSLFARPTNAEGIIKFDQGGDIVVLKMNQLAKVVPLSS